MIKEHMMKWDAYTPNNLVRGPDGQWRPARIQVQLLHICSDRYRHLTVIALA